MTQKELKAVYTEELKKAWSTENMVKHCSKNTAFVIEHKGALYGIEKPSIETRFCFGYGMNGISDDEDRNMAENMVDKASRNKEYFINQNLHDINLWIDRLNEMLENMVLNWAEGSYPRYLVETGKKYYSQFEDCKLRYYCIVDTFNGTNRGEICMDTELIKKLITGYEQVKTEFTKRLNTYLNRYGLSKVEPWSYLRE